MTLKKKFLMALLALALLSVVAAGLAYSRCHYVLVSFRFYPRSAQTLDLRDQRISPAHYEKLQAKLPDALIFWNVPIGEQAFPNDAEAITLDTLSPGSLSNFRWFTALETVNAQNCTDYAALQALEAAFPHLDVRYAIHLGGVPCDPEAETIAIPGIPEEALEDLAFLPNLKRVLCTGGAGEPLQAYCRRQNLSFAIQAGDTVLEESTREAAPAGVTDTQVSLFRLLPQLRKLHLVDPKAQADSLFLLRSQLPGAAVTWEKEVCGVLCRSDARELDLSKAKSIDLEEITAAMAFFPDAETVFLGQCGIDNDTLAQYRQDLRSRFKLVWTVSLGKKLQSRTDATTFMPVRERVYYFKDEEAYNLRYCEDMVCIDIGHMSIRSIDFVKFMPNLTYLILAHTQVSDLGPIATCKNLKFLELDWSPVRDLSPLVGCTALEDLNLGNTFGDFAPIGKMTWLKNLWVIHCSGGTAYRMSQALPNTKVQGAGSATVDSGWRDLPNYYKMRDLLGMHYMSW